MIYSTLSANHKTSRHGRRQVQRNLASGLVADTNFADNHSVQQHTLVLIMLCGGLCVTILYNYLHERVLPTALSARMRNNYLVVSTIDSI